MQPPSIAQRHEPLIDLQIGQRLDDPLPKVNAAVRSAEIATKLGIWLLDQVLIIKSYTLI